MSSNTTNTVFSNHEEITTHENNKNGIRRKPDNNKFTHLLRELGVLLDSVLNLDHLLFQTCQLGGDIARNVESFIPFQHFAYEFPQGPWSRSLVIDRQSVQHTLHSHLLLVVVNLLLDVLLLTVQSLLLILEVNVALQIHVNGDLVVDGLKGTGVRILVASVLIQNALHRASEGEALEIILNALKSSEHSSVVCSEEERRSVLTNKVVLGTEGTDLVDHGVEEGKLLLKLGVVPLSVLEVDSAVKVTYELRIAAQHDGGGIVESASS